MWMKSKSKLMSKSKKNISMKKLLPLLLLGFLSIIIGALILSRENKETSQNRDISQMSNAPSFIKIQVLCWNTILIKRSHSTSR